MSTAIRAAIAEDAPRLVELLSRQMAEHHLRTTPEALARAVAAALSNPGVGSFLVAVVGGETIGVAYIAFLHSIEHAGAIALLEELYVLPEHRGRGAGSALLRSAVEQFSVAPGRPMELEVDASHREAESFYQRHGFTIRQRSRWIHVPSEPAF